MLNVHVTKGKKPCSFHRSDCITACGLPTAASGSGTDPTGPRECGRHSHTPGETLTPGHAQGQGNSGRDHPSASRMLFARVHGKQKHNCEARFTPVLNAVLHRSRSALSSGLARLAGRRPVHRKAAESLPRQGTYPSGSRVQSRQGGNPPMILSQNQRPYPRARIKRNFSLKQPLPERHSRPGAGALLATEPPGRSHQPG